MTDEAVERLRHIIAQRDAVLARIRQRLREAEERAKKAETENVRLREALGEQRHIVEFRGTLDEGDWGLQHPVECRPDLIGCAVNRAIQEEVDFIGGAPVEAVPGRYVVTLGPNGPDYQPLATQAQEDIRDD